MGIITGTEGDDDFIGTLGADTLFGLGGHDTLYGNDGNDIVNGGEGNDQLVGGDGNDIVIGGNGNDNIGSFDGNEVLKGDAGNDSFFVHANAGKVQIDGGADTDSLTLIRSNTAKAIVFSIADPTIKQTLSDGSTVVGIEQINFYGTAYNDQVIGGAMADDLFGGNGLDYLNGGGGNDELRGEANNDTLNGADGNNTLDGGSGNDALYSATTGADTIVGGSGSDRLDFNRVSSTVAAVFTIADPAVMQVLGDGSSIIGIEKLSALLGSGDDIVTGGALEDAIYGGVGGDTLAGGGKADVLWGQEGADLLDGGSGIDQMNGGIGDDVFIVDDTADKTAEKTGEGTDTVIASATFSLIGQFVENLTLTGDADIDGTGNGLVNVLTGNGGDNLLNGFSGADVMAGGQGDDTYLVDNAGDAVTEVNGEGVDLVKTSVDFSLVGQFIENLTLTGAADLDGIGNGLANVLTGNGGDNLLNGLAGADTLAGGAGDDTYVVDNLGDTVSELGGGGFDLVQSTVNFNLALDIEALTLTGSGNISGSGNAAANTLVGNTGDNGLNGGGGIDSMAGGAGNDLYVVDTIGDQAIESAGQGSDTVQSSVSFSLAGQELEILTLTGTGDTSASGNDAANVMTGNVGSNTLNGFGGMDTLTGGAGADFFVFSTDPAAANVDTIADFVSADDTIRLDNAVFAQLGTDGALAAGLFRYGATAQDANDRIIYNGSTGALYYDADGNGAGAQVQVAVLATGLVIGTSDFAVV